MPRKRRMSLSSDNLTLTQLLAREVASAVAHILVTNGAIRSHHTETDAGAWDSGANVKNLSNEDGKAVYRQMFAWVDTEADKDKKKA